MPPSLPFLRPREVLRKLKKAGFYEVRQSGSHLQLRSGNLLVTLPMHSRDTPPGTLRSILRQARLSIEEFLDL